MKFVFSLLLLVAALINPVKAADVLGDFITEKEFTTLQSVRSKMLVCMAFSELAADAFQAKAQGKTVKTVFGKKDPQVIRTAVTATVSIGVRAKSIDEAALKAHAYCANNANLWKVLNEVLEDEETPVGPRK